MRQVVVVVAPPPSMAGDEAVHAGDDARVMARVDVNEAKAEAKHVR